LAKGPNPSMSEPEKKKKKGETKKRRSDLKLSGYSREGRRETSQEGLVRNCILPDFYSMGKGGGGDQREKKDDALAH